MASDAELGMGGDTLDTPLFPSTTKEALDIVKALCGYKTFAVLIDCITQLEIRCGDLSPPAPPLTDRERELLAAATRYLADPCNKHQQSLRAAVARYPKPETTDAHDKN